MSAPNRSSGTCHCGHIALSVPADTFGLVACHCSDCQSLHGNAFAMLVVARDDLEWNEDLVAWYRSSEGSYRGHCPVCGSRVAKAPVGGSKVMLSVGLFPTDLDRTVVKHVHTDSKPRWYAD